MQTYLPEPDQRPRNRYGLGPKDRPNRAEDDGVSYLTDTVTAQSIRDDTDYTGVRIIMDCQISTAPVKLKLDINVGDPVTPAPQLIELPSQRPDAPAIKLLGYPIETVLAEKISTAITLGEANTRVRDYSDLHVLTGKHTVSFDTMRSALQATTAHRGYDQSARFAWRVRPTGCPGRPGVVPSGPRHGWTVRDRLLIFLGVIEHGEQ